MHREGRHIGDHLHDGHKDLDDHLSPGLPGSLGLRSHRSLQLHWKAHVLHLVVVMVVVVVVVMVVVLVLVVVVVGVTWIV